MAKHPTRAFVYPVKDHAADIQKLEQLIKEAGCEVVCEHSDPSVAKKCLQDADVLVVLICAEAMSDPALKELISIASRAGKRVVGVWAPGTKDSTLPSAVNKYGDALIELNPKSVKETVCGGASIWSMPDGSPRPKPKTPRHKG